MNPEQHVFETDRLLIRPTSLDDKDFIFELMNTEKWITNIGNRNIKTIDDAAAYIEQRMLPQLDKLGFSNYTVIRKKDNVKIGTCGLYDREGLEGIDIGFAFLPEYEGQGYALESANKIKQMAIVEFGMKRIVAITKKDNYQSQNLLKKLGFSFEGMTSLKDDESELLLFSINID